MKTADLRNYVEDFLAKDGSDVQFKLRIEELAKVPGYDVSSRDIECLADLARDYIYAVIGLLVECERAAESQDARGFADPLVKIAVKYFVDPNDLIPDSMGLYGLIDDAYLAHRFIIRLSETVEAEKGFPLIASVEDEYIGIIREIVGDEIATKLDQKVEESVHSVTVRNQMARLSMLSGTLPTHDSELWAKVKADGERITWRPKG